MTRTEELKWVKERALAELEAVGPGNAMGSFTSDVQKCDTLKNDPVITGLMPIGMRHAFLGEREELKKWIEGFS
jgi:hypothetical protein